MAVGGADRYLARWIADAAPGDLARLRRAIRSLAASLRSGAPHESEAFVLLRGLAHEAAFAHPSHGGNRDGWGWRLVGTVGDPQPRGFTTRELAEATPVRDTVRPLTRWTAGFVSRTRTRSDDADVVVVGLGAAGGVIAADLAEAGLRVIALEAGPARVRASTDEREFQVRHRLFWHEPEHLVVNGGAPIRGSWLARNIGVGGPLHWTTITYRFHPSDFRVRSSAGHITETSVDDWPITYEELAPYYARAEREIGVAGTAGANPYEGARDAFPMRPLTLTRSAALFADAARRLGYAPYATPAAVVTGRRGARLACNACGHCSHYECLRKAKGNTRDTVLVRAAKTGKLDVRADARAERVLVGRDGRATGVRYRGPGGRRDVTARTVVLANGAAYQARLLLISTSRDHPSGLANSSGLVGRNLMFHTNVMAWGVFDELVYADRGPQTGAAFDDLDEDRPRERHGASFRRGAAIVGGLPITFAGGPLAFANALGVTAKLPAGVPSYGAGFREFVAHAYARHFGAFALCEDLPMEENRIELDPTIRLADGGPGLRIHYRYHRNTLEMEEFMESRLAAVVREAGARATYTQRSALPAGMFAGHHMGTVRMGRDPRTSVANADGRAHDIPNLFLAGSGLFVTSAGVNPTGTIWALAFRTARAIARDHGVTRAQNVALTGAGRGV